MFHPRPFPFPTYSLPARTTGRWRVAEPVDAWPARRPVCRVRHAVSIRFDTEAGSRWWNAECDRNLDYPGHPGGLLLASAAWAVRSGGIAALALVTGAITLASRAPTAPRVLTGSLLTLSLEASDGIAPDGEAPAQPFLRHLLTLVHAAPGPAITLGPCETRPIDRPGREAVATLASLPPFHRRLTL